MPLVRQARAAALSVTLLVAGLLSVAPAAGAEPAGCVQSGRDLRYVVVFDQGTAEPDATAEITDACGSTTVYYAPIAVAVASSPDPGFLSRIGADRAYSAQAESYGMPRGKIDETAAGPRVIPAAHAGVPTQDRTGEQWDMAMIGADRAHEVSEGSAGVVVGVLDSGIDPAHPDLRPALDPARSAGCLSGRPDQAEKAWAPTSSAHGTHIAGIIAAADDGRGITGVAPGVRLASVKVVDDDGYIYPEYAVCGFMWAAEQAMTVTNSSYFVDPWVFTCRDSDGEQVVYEALRRAVEYATHRGVLNIAAATNTGMDLASASTDTVSPDNGNPVRRDLDSGCGVLPAELRGVTTVSSVGPDRLKAGYSSYGLGVIDVTAPGGEYQPDGGGCVLSTVPGGYDRFCGTSMAAPHVTGVAALLASRHPNSSPARLVRLLNAGADPVNCPADYDLRKTGAQDGYCAGYAEYNGFYGHGMVNARSAVN